MRIDGKDLENMPFDQLGAVLDWIADELDSRAGSLEYSPASAMANLAFSIKRDAARLSALQNNS
jgi:hypothetical protein